MKTTLLLLLFMYLLCPTKPQTTDTAMDSLGWIAGRWEMNIKGRTVTEQWMEPAGKVMIGMSRSVKDGKVYAYECIRLVEENGSIQYIAQPSGQEETAFVMVQGDRSRAVFENLAHDFPQRIIYRRVLPDSLIVQIEGEMGGTLKRIEFPFRRRNIME